MTFLSNEQFYVPAYKKKKIGSNIVLFDPEYPNWIAVDEKGAKVIDMIKEHLSFKEIVNRYSHLFNVDSCKAWLHVNSFIRSAIREKFVSLSAPDNKPYTGRSNHLKLKHLTELWIHINNKCNLSCSHCLVESGPKGKNGMSADNIKRYVEQASNLNVSRFFITGGEPFIRSDIFELIDYIIAKKEAELIILTNGTLLTGERIKKLSRYADTKLKLQISLDGSSPEINDPIRGKGSFSSIVQGIKRSIDAGFHPTVTTALNNLNMRDVPEIVKYISSIGVKNHHLLWLHPRGRALNGNGNFTLSPEDMLSIVREAKRLSEYNGLTIDNYEAIKTRAHANRGIKYDGSNACWQSLCIYSNGDIYPSASLAGITPLCMGNIEDTSLENIWLKSPISDYIRKVSVIHKKGCSDCFLRYICGGGDMESTYLYSYLSDKNGDFQAFDPYCSLYKGMILDTIYEEIEERKKIINNRSGFDAPIIIAAKSKNNTCSDSSGYLEGETVEILRSNCVLSIDLDISRKKVRDFYGRAAEKPQADLCCPTSYDRSDTAHIPKEALERFYGCGSPMSLADPVSGETVIDIGSGAGIDCFIAAKYVGIQGRVIGIDMTDNMLKIARDCKIKVSNNLGYDVVEFRKGFLEDIPVDDKSADLITSNCVINLSPDKKMVFNQMWRILKDFGRILISDIVSEKDVPSCMQANPRLWGECISGALTKDAFIAALEESGFYGISLIKKFFWKEVDGYKFFSITVRGYKYEKKTGCVYRGEKAIYNGPYISVIDEEGHFFPRGEPVEVCTDTAAKLRLPPYKDHFIISTPDRNIIENCCDESDAGCC